MRSPVNVIAVLSAIVAWSLETADAFVTTSKPWIGGHSLRSSRSSSSLMMSSGNPGVVITGAAGGVGFAYAGEFMDRGYDVVICDVRDCSAAAKALTSRHPNGSVFHTKCDVSDNASVEKLGQFAKEKLGTIGYWINNAGVNGGRRALMDVPVNQVELVVKVNLLGTLLCTKAAMDIMAQQVGLPYWAQAPFLKDRCSYVCAILSLSHLRHLKLFYGLTLLFAGNLLLNFDLWTLS